MALTKVSYSMIEGAVVNVLDFGAVGDGVTDDAAAIQAAMDSVATPDQPLTVVFPTDTGALYAISTTLIIKNSNLHMVGLGGRVVIKYIGTGAAALPMVRAYKDVDHIRNGSPENYQNVRLKNIRLDGNNLALRGLDVFGFTRKCGADECSFFASVLPLKVRDGFYSSWNNVEVHETPLTPPVGMDAGTYAANLYGIYLEVCHIASFKNLIMFAVGGNVSNPYTATFYAYISEGLSVQSYTIEEGQQSAHGRYVTNVMVIDPSTTVHFDSAYIESIEANNSIIDIDENAVVRFTNTYFNGIKAVDFVKMPESAQLVFDSTFGEGFDLQDRLFQSTATNLYGVQLLGATTFAAGSITGGEFDANGTTNSKQGLICDPILTAAGASSSFNGYKVSGYSVSISGDNIVVAPGVYHLNGQTVQFGRNTSSDQLLRPDLSVAATWNVRISGAGTPYIERILATKVGSSHNPIIATYTTAGGGAAPTGLQQYNNPVTRLTGAIEGPLATTYKLNKTFSGQATLADSGSAAFSDLLEITLSVVGGEDDSIGVIMDYIVSTGAGLTRSAETGQMFVAMTQDSGGNVVAGSPVKVGTAQALDAGMASMTTTFNLSVASNVITLQMKNETSTDSSSTVFFAAKLMGRVRDGTTILFGANATQAI
jgi:hypothetical protein